MRTSVIGISILVFAEFALPGYKWIQRSMGTDIWMFTGIWIMMAGCGVFLFTQLKFTKAGAMGRILLITCAAAAAVLVCLSPLIEARGERIHILIFGALGWSVALDLQSRSYWTRIITGMIVCSAIAALDEIFQSFLPGRFGQWKDILLGSIGGLIGAVAAFARPGDNETLS
ncbi:MAG: VanZ family protein [Leptospirales bacterium]|nr:VanZ family protein [Leptospirales bacterium]